MEDQPGSLTDAQLLQRSASGDRAAFGSLVARHQASLFRFARAITRDAAAAEDVLQETFLAALRSAGAYRGEASVKTWLLTIARNKAYRAGRRRSGQPERFESLEALGAEAGWGALDSVDAVLIERQRRELFSRALAGLAPEDREMIVLRDLEGLGGEQVAELLRISLAAVKSRLHRARLRLAARVRQEGVQHGA